MKAAVIGAGGIGGLLGGALARAGHEVRLLARGPHLAAIREHGLTVESTELGSFTVPAAATDRPEELGQNDVAIVAVKLYDFEAACLATKAALAPDGVAITLQNGLDAPFELARVAGRERVLIGTISLEAAIKAPGVIAHTSPFHRMTVSELEGPVSPRVTALVEQLTRAGIVAAAADDGKQALWNKAAYLVPIATLTSAGDLVFGDITGSPELRQLFADLCDELAALAKADGYDVTPAIRELQELMPNVPNFTSSMNRDFRAGRRVELEWLTGRVVHLGQERGIPTPAHAAPYALLKHRAAGFS